jgi:tetratricopeptide (TPR) repeat protein
MAPERLRGWSDPRSDVYSLGLTLYELLTLEPAYDDDDRGRLVKKILEEPPPRPGRRRPGIARDLETVVLTAISKEPGDRYQTAREFHDDLERFLEGKPIQAKPASTWERGMKWARRRPAAAALVVVSSLALMTLLLGTTWYNSRLQVAAERAGRNLEDSRKAMEVMLRWFAERRLKSQQGIDQVSRQVAEEARNFYDVLERQAISPIVQRDVARAYRRIGDLERSLGQVTQAETDYRRAADVWRRGGFGHELAAEDRAEGRTIHNRWSMALAVCDQAGEAEDAYRTTLSFMDEAPRFSFIRSAKFPVGAGPIGFTVGDWNGDGKIDLATTCIFANNVTALLAAGAGAFSAPLFFAAGNRPISLASGDLDGDRDLDLAVANRDSLSLSILANDGAGGFSASEDYRLADRVWGVRAGDLDGDHRLDLAAVTGVTGAPDSDLWVARNRGGGKFSDPERCPSQGGPNDLAIADVEGDGDLDVLVACTGAAATNYLGCVALHVNDGRGSLTARNDLAAGPTPRFVTAADLDGDGAPDLVASNWQVDKVSVLRNLGSTKFAEPLPLETGLQPHGTIACDLDDDRDLDLAVASIDSDEVNVFASRGNGTYLPPVSFAAGDGTCFLGAADADGDGRPDLLAVNMNSNDISLLFNRPAAKPDEAAAPAGPAQEGR